MGKENQIFANNSANSPKIPKLYVHSSSGSLCLLKEGKTRVRKSHATVPLSNEIFPVLHSKSMENLKNSRLSLKSLIFFPISKSCSLLVMFWCTYSMSMV